MHTLHYCVPLQLQPCHTNYDGVRYGPILKRVHASRDRLVPTCNVVLIRVRRSRVVIPTGVAVAVVLVVVATVAAAVVAVVVVVAVAARSSFPRRNGFRGGRVLGTNIVRGQQSPPSFDREIVILVVVVVVVRFVFSVPARVFRDRGLEGLFAPGPVDHHTSAH